jgi:integrase
MVLPTYLRKRGGRFFIRIAIPNRYRQACGKLEIGFAIGTASLQVARIRSARVALSWSEFMLDLNSLPDDAIASRVDAWLTREKFAIAEDKALGDAPRAWIDPMLDAQAAARAASGSATPTEMDRATSARLALTMRSAWMSDEDVEARTRDAVIGKDREWARVLDPWIDAAVSEIVTPAAGILAMAVVRREVARRMPDLARHFGVVSRNEDEPHPVTLGVPPLASAHAAETVPAAPTPAIPSPAKQGEAPVCDTTDTTVSTPIRPDVSTRPPMVLSELAPLYLRAAMPNRGERKSDIGLTKATASQAKSSLKLLGAIVGDQPLASLTSVDGANFRTKMRSLPWAYYHSKEYRPLYIADDIETLIARREAREEQNPDDPLAKRLEAKTFNKHYSALSTFVEWATKLGYVPRSNEFFLNGLFIDLEADPDVHVNDRSSWSDDDLKRLFGSPLFHGMASHEKWHEKGTFLVRDERYWLPLMSAFLGSRIDELAQLKVKHIKTAYNAEGVAVPYISLKDKATNVKEAASRRVIPFHRDLIDLGFMEDRVDGRLPEEWVFPEIRAQNALEKRSAPFVRFFERCRKRLGIGKTLHELRNTFITQAHRKVPGDKSAHAEAITGHASKLRSTVFLKYSDDWAAVELKPFVDLVELPIDIQALKCAAANAVPWQDYAQWRSLRGRKPAA